MFLNCGIMAPLPPGANDARRFFLRYNMARKLERIDTKRLYCEDLKEIPQISKELNVPEKTLYRWAKDDKWDEQREAMRATSVSAIKQMMSLATAGMQEIVRDVKADGLKALDSQKVFALSKLIRDGKTLSRGIVT